ncbi:hypothetical protein [Plantactinospora sp. KLBMP9567]|uniref:ATP-binding protein n=1 Tax=Plantactinospora sp. KLBMP9567 TaxID=3085900 RepID=UPI002980B69A|nr:hypothetical protein [Plantactinospora sp. KLBMP9567]MDW5329510.1 hypothetical protein [Plantactinospora sp. KLBMP9567]
MADAVDLVLPNIAEFNLRHPSLRFDPAAAQGFAGTAATLADPAVFWSAGRRIVVLPPGYDETWFADVHTALGTALPPVVSPAHRSGLLVRDLLHDGAALAALRAAVAPRRLVRLVSWGATPELYILAATLTGWGNEVELDIPEEADYWSSLYLDSKASCVDLAGFLPELRVPRPITVNDWVELRGAIHAVHATGRPAVVRSMYGAGGEGSVRVPAERRALARFWSTAHRDPFFRSFPLLVQEFVDHAAEQSCPAVDMLLTADGVERIVTSAMIVDGLRCGSVNVGTGAVAAAPATRIARLAERIGRAAIDLGFRGWFCVDYLVGADGEVYVTEFNARRSGAMGAITLADRPGMAGLGMHLSLALPIGVGPGRSLSYRADIRPLFRRLWDAGVRAYPTTVRGLSQARPNIGVLAAAETAADAERIVTEIRTTLSGKSRDVGCGAGPAEVGGDRAPRSAGSERSRGTSLGT